MQSIRDIINEPLKPLNTAEFGLYDDEYVADDQIWCKTCKTPRTVVIGNLRFRRMCDCEQTVHEREEAERRGKERQEKIIKLQRASLIGERYRSCTFASVQTDHNESFARAYSRCAAYCDNTRDVLSNGYGIYLYGSVGTGKTTLTACMANKLMQDYRQVLFTSFIEIGKEIRRTFSNNETESEVVNRIASIDFLFIDDIGTEGYVRNGSDTWIQERVYDVINKRYGSKKPTVFSSNYTLNELVAERGMMEKTVDRIGEMSNAVLHITGENYRRRATASLPF